VLGISDRQVDYLRKSGQLPTVHIGITPLIPQSAVIALIDQAKARAATSEAV